MCLILCGVSALVEWCPAAAGGVRAGCFVALAQLSELVGGVDLAVWVAAVADDAPRATVDVVGPVCETGDVFATARRLPPLASGDLLAIRSAGAYGAVMSSAYNTRPPAAEVLVKDTAFAVVRARATIDDLLAQDSLPAWLATPAAGARGAA